jgi:hypothetical protein
MNGGEPPVFTQLNQVVAGIVAFVINFGGLIAVGASLKMSKSIVTGAQNLLSGNSGKLQGFLKGNANDPGSLQNRVKHNVGQNARAAAAHRLNATKDWTTGAPKTNSAIGKKLWGARRRATNAMLAGVQGYGVDLGRRQAEENEKFDKYIGQKTSNGDDNLERAFFAKQWTDDDRTFTDPDTKETQTLKKGRYYSTYRGTDGTYKEFSAGDVAASHHLYDRDEGKIQTLMKYELGKVSNDAELYGVDSAGDTIYDPTQIATRNDKTRQPMGGFLGNIPSTLRDSGLNNTSAMGASIGAFYSKQGERRELKHTRLGANWEWKQGKDEFVQDFAENVGSYATASGKSSPVKRLTQLYNEYDTQHQGYQTQQAAINAGIAPVGPLVKKLTPVQQRSYEDMQRIAAALDTRMNMGGGGAQQQTALTQGNPQQPGQGGSTSGGTSGGAGRTNEAIQEFIHTVRKGTPMQVPNVQPVGRELTPRP